VKDRTVVITDCGSGLLIAALGVLAVSPAAVAGFWWLVVATAAVSGAATYADEHLLSDRPTRDRLRVYLGAAAVFVAVTAATVAVTPLGPTVAAALAVAGFGIATAVNRLVFGLVYPLPSTRRDRAEKYSV